MRFAEPQGSAWLPFSAILVPFVYLVVRPLFSEGSELGF